MLFYFITDFPFFSHFCLLNSQFSQRLIETQKVFEFGYLSISRERDDIVLLWSVCPCLTRGRWDEGERGTLVLLWTVCPCLTRGRWDEGVRGTLGGARGNLQLIIFAS